MAEQIPPSREYLQQFESPLWELLDLEDCKPLTIIEGTRAHFPFIVIEMQHAAYGPFSDNGKTTTSTFFVVRHGQPAGAKLHTSPSQSYQVSTDRDCVYLVIPGKKVRPGAWETMLGQACNVAMSLADHGATWDNQVTRGRSYTPAGAGVLIYACWFLISLSFAILSFVFGIGGLLGMTKLDSNKSASTSLAWQFLLFSAGAFGGAYYYYKRIKKRL